MYTGVMSILDVVLEVNALLLIHLSYLSLCTGGADSIERCLSNMMISCKWLADHLFKAVASFEYRTFTAVIELSAFTALMLYWLTAMSCSVWLIDRSKIFSVEFVIPFCTCRPCWVSNHWCAMSVSDWLHKWWCAAAVTEQIGCLCASQHVIRPVQLKTVFVSVKLDLLSWDRSLNVNTWLTSAAWLKKNCSPRPRSRRRSTWDHWVCKVVTSLVVC